MPDARLSIVHSARSGARAVGDPGSIQSESPAARTRRRNVSGSPAARAALSPKPCAVAENSSGAPRSACGESREPDPSLPGPLSGVADSTQAPSAGSNNVMAVETDLLTKRASAPICLTTPRPSHASTGHAGSGDVVMVGPHEKHRHGVSAYHLTSRGPLALRGSVDNL